MSAALAPVHLPEPALRSVTAHVTGGLDGALRVAVLLRSRGYRVRDLTLHVDEGAAASRVTATAVVTPDELDLLLARVSRLPVVLAARADIRLPRPGSGGEGGDVLPSSEGVPVEIARWSAPSAR